MQLNARISADPDAERPRQTPSFDYGFGDLLPEMCNIAIYTASSAGARCAMLGGGGIGGHEASAVTGGGIEEQPCAVLGGGGIPSIPNGPGGGPWPTRLRPHRIPYPYSAPDGPSGHCPAAKTTVLAHRALPAPRPAPPFSRRCFGRAARHSRFRCVPRPRRPTRRSPSPAASRASRTGRGRGHRQPRQLIARSVRWRSETTRKHPAICQVTSSKRPKPAGLPPACVHRTVTA